MFKGQRIYIIGDSLSVKGPTPGQVLAAELRSVGAIVEVDATGGFALSYWRPKVGHTKFGAEARAKSARCITFEPSLVLVLLGMNDYAQPREAIRAGIQALRASLPGKRVLFVGPPAVAPGKTSGYIKGLVIQDGLNKVQQVLGLFAGSYMSTFELSKDLLYPPLRSTDYIHFSAKGAKTFGTRMFYALQKRLANRGAPSLTQSKVERFIALGVAGWVLSKLLDRVFK